MDRHALAYSKMLQIDLVDFYRYKLIDEEKGKHIEAYCETETEIELNDHDDSSFCEEKTIMMVMGWTGKTIDVMRWNGQNIELMRWGGRWTYTDDCTQASMVSLCYF